MMLFVCPSHQFGFNIPGSGTDPGSGGGDAHPPVKIKNKKREREGGRKGGREEKKGKRTLLHTQDSTQIHLRLHNEYFDGCYRSTEDSTNNHLLLENDCFNGCYLLMIVLRYTYCYTLTIFMVAIYWK